MRRPILALLAAAGLAACSDTTSPSAGDQVSVSFSTGSPSGASASLTGGASGAAVAGVSIAVGTDALVITRARLVLEELELESEDYSCERSMAAAGMDTTDAVALRRRCENEVEFGPIVVDLPLDGSLRGGIDLAVPNGLYSEVKFDIEPLDDSDAYDASVRARHPELGDASIRVDGTYNGEPFVYVTGLEADMVLDLQPDLVVTNGAFNVTVRVDVRSWFRASDGGLIDPRSANAGGPNEEQVAANILASLHAFADGDRDGRDDSN